jgi:hypothetical protein
MDSNSLWEHIMMFSFKGRETLWGHITAFIFDEYERAKVIVVPDTTDLCSGLIGKKGFMHVNHMALLDNEYICITSFLFF